MNISKVYKAGAELGGFLLMWMWVDMNWLKFSR